MSDVMKSEAAYLAAGLYAPREEGRSVPRPVLDSFALLDRKWRRVAVSAGPGHWRWDLTQADQVLLRRLVERGGATTVQERRPDGIVWLLAGLVR
jgi:hypothetical protein